MLLLIFYLLWHYWLKLSLKYFAYDFSLSLSIFYHFLKQPCPYHSKYNPVERTFAWLEKHWNGSLLDSLETVLEFAKTLTIRGKNPVVTLVDKIYHTGVKLTKAAMEKVEEQLERFPDLKKWFVSISVNFD